MLTWVSNFTHPLERGVYIQAELPPCQTCAKLRSLIPGAPQLKPTVMEGVIETVFQRQDKVWYKLKNGKLVQEKDVKFVRTDINS